MSKHNAIIPNVSIIVPVYRVEPYLRECLDSVLAQTCSDWECILVDDVLVPHHLEALLGAMERENACPVVSYTRWFVQKGYTQAQRPHLRSFFRSVRKNMFCECSRAKLTFREFRQLQEQYPLPAGAAEAYGLEFLLEDHGGSLYFHFYMLLMRLRSLLKHGVPVRRPENIGR